MRTLPLIACLLLVTMAGCSALPFGSDGSTADPYVASGDELNASQLVTDHTDALNASGSATHTQQIHVTTAEMTRQNTTIMYQSDYDTPQYFFTYTSHTNDATVEVYSTPNASYSREYQDGSYSYEYTEENRIPQFNSFVRGTNTPSATGGIQLESLISTGSWTQQGVDSHTLDDGEKVEATKFTLNDVNETGIEEMFQLAPDSVTVYNTTGELLVNEDGLIYEYQVQYELSTARLDNVTVTISDSFTKVGTTTVTEPDWTATAKEEGNTTETPPPQATFDFDYNSSADTLTITHAGGDILSADHLGIVVGDETVVTWASAATDTDGEVQAGDTVTVEASSGQTVQIFWTNDSQSHVLTEYLVS